MLRKTIFWTHLVVAVSVGIVVFIMSATGVMLTFEAQLLEWDESRRTVMPAQGQTRIATDQVLDIARSKHPEENHFYIRWVNQPGRPIPVWAGLNSYLISPYTGEILLEGESWVVEFVHFNTDLHRWLAIEGENKSIAKGITAYSNLLFIFLIISGAYLWLPRKLNWKLIEHNLRFKRHAKNRHAKHFNWHHVFGFWALIPLFVISITATIFHFGWANELMYGIYGEDAPGPRTKPSPVAIVDGEQSYEKLFSIAKQHAEENGVADWHSMWLEFGRKEGSTRFWIDPSLGNSYARAYELFLDNNTAEVVSVKRGQDWSKGSQAWGVARFLHTGEYFGLFGQIIAGLASLAACFLVYTGFCLSWRRLVTPLLKKKVKR